MSVIIATQIPHPALAGTPLQEKGRGEGGEGALEEGRTRFLHDFLPPQNAQSQHSSDGGMGREIFFVKSAPTTNYQLPITNYPMPY